MTTVHRRGGKRVTWKYRALTIAVYLGLLSIAVTVGASVFVGLQKLESMNLRRHCSKYKNWLLEQRKDCSKPSIDQCAATKSMYDNIAACYQQPIGSPKPPNTFARAVVYAFSIYTTIGYGNVAAQSREGQIFTILYALISIPLFLAFVNHYAKWFHYALVCTYEELRRRTGAGKQFVLTVADAEDAAMFCFALFILLVELCLAAAFYSTLQGWKYWHSFYFAFQSVSLIGFGDIYAELEDPSFIMWHLAITTVGIILLAMCLFVLRDWWFRVAEAVTDALAVKFKMVLPRAGNGDNDTLREFSATFSMSMDELGRVVGGGTAASPKASVKTSGKRSKVPPQTSKKRLPKRKGKK